MRRFAFVVLILILGTAVQAQQTKEDLEKERKEIQREIEELRQSQSSVKKDKKKVLRS